MNVRNMHNLFALIAILAVGSVPAHAAPLADKPPTARTVDVVDHDFGLTLPDPYRWMEGKDNAEFQAWLKAQGEYTRSKLDALPTLAAWRERLAKATAEIVVHASHQRAGGRLFFMRLSGKGKASLFMREKDGAERLLLDPNKLDDTQGASITEYAPSPDGRLVAINVDRGGSEITRIRVMEAASGKWLSDAVEPVWGEFPANWLPDSSGFSYTQMAPEKERPDGDPVQGMRTRFHRLGTGSEKDPALLRAGLGEGSNPTFELKNNEFPFIALSPESKWAYASAGDVRLEQRICITSRAGVLDSKAKWHCLAEYADAVRDAALHGDTLYLLSMLGRPNGRVLAIDMSKPDASLKTARETLSTSEDAVVTGIAAARDALYVKRMRNGTDSILRIDYADGKVTSIAMPFEGSVQIFHADPQADGVLFSLQGWIVPQAAYLYEPSNPLPRDLKLGTESPADYSMLASVETETVSANGARVPLSIIHPKDVRLDGGNRAILGGYGGYGVSLQPSFSPLGLEWVKAGGIYAIAHVRGGGEKGDAWHRAGQGVNKYKGVEDILACVRELARLKYSTPERTALRGGSMGGLLVGGALTRAPDAFGAAIIEVGVLNPVRLLAGINGANQIAEVGDPRTAEGLKALAAMDPYQNIKERTKYPAVLLPVGLNDGWASPWETGKFAAKLRAASIGGKPTWIRTDADTPGTGSIR